MARLPRLAAAGQVHHVVLAAAPGAPLFVADEDRVAFLDALSQHAKDAGIDWHGYVLTDDRVRLLLRPASGEALSRCIQALGRHYAAWTRRQHGRQGALWAGRYRAAIIEPTDLLLSTLVAFDTEPVRAALAVSAAAWPWSSYGVYAGLRRDPRLTLPPVYWDLGNTPFAREAAYRARVEAGLTRSEVQKLFDAAWHGWALGSEAFLTALQQQVQRRVRPGRPGRPRAASQ